MNCLTCLNCQTRNHWEALYKAYLKTNPQDLAWVNSQRRLDKILRCLNAPKKHDELDNWAIANTGEF